MDARSVKAWARSERHLTPTLTSHRMPSSQVAAIRASRRWALSGTPMPTGPADLEGQIAALQMAPYDDARVFNARLNPLTNGLVPTEHRT